MATHSSVLAWRIPGMGEPGGLPSMGSHRVGYDWSDLAAAAISSRWMTAKNKMKQNKNTITVKKAKQNCKTHNSDLTSTYIWLYS